MNLSPEQIFCFYTLVVALFPAAMVITVIQIRDSVRDKRTLRAILRLGTARRASVKAMNSARGGSTPGGTDEYVATLLRGSTDDMDRVLTLLINELPRSMQSEVRL